MATIALRRRSIALAVDVSKLMDLVSDRQDVERSVVTENGMRLNDWKERILTWPIVASFTFAFVTLGYAWINIIEIALDAVRHGLIKTYFISVFCLPAAGFGAYMVVVIFQQTSGPLELEGLTFKFKGPAGPVVLWILAFLAMVAGFMMVSWQLPTS